MLNGQLELSLKAERMNRRRALRRAPRATAAHWWFERMRQVVDRAIDYPPTHPESDHSLARFHRTGVLFQS